MVVDDTIILSSLLWIPVLWVEQFLDLFEVLPPLVVSLGVHYFGLEHLGSWLAMGRLKSLWL